MSSTPQLKMSCRSRKCWFLIFARSCNKHQWWWEWISLPSFACWKGLLLLVESSFSPSLPQAGQWQLRGQQKLRPRLLSSQTKGSKTWPGLSRTMGYSCIETAWLNGRCSVRWANFQVLQRFRFLSTWSRAWLYALPRTYPLWISLRGRISTRMLLLKTF